MNASRADDTYKRVSAVSAQREPFKYRGGGAVCGSLWRQHVARSPAGQCQHSLDSSAPQAGTLDPPRRRRVIHY